MKRWYVFLLMGALVAPAALAQDSAFEARKAQLSLRAQQAVQMHRSLSNVSQAPAETYVLEASTFHIWSDDAWTPYTETEYTYEDGRLTEILRTSTFNGIVSARSLTLYSYDSSGRVITQEDRYWDAAQEEYLPEQRVTNAYSGGSSWPVETISEEWDVDSEAYINAERTTVDIEFSNGTIVQMVGQDYQWDGDSWEAMSRYTIEEDGTSVVAVSQDWTGIEWENTERSVFEDVSISAIVEAMEEFERELVGDDLVTLFLAAFLLPDATHQEWQDGEWVDVARQTTERWVDLFTGALTRTETTATQYDEETESWSGMRLITSYELTGNTSRPDSVLLQMEMAEDEWMTYLEQTLEYDELGNVTDIFARVMAEDGEGDDDGMVNYSWRTQTWIGVGTSAGGDEVATSFQLHPAYPNPFNPSTRLDYEMKTSGHVSIQVYDLLGRRVATLFEGPQVAGTHEVRLDADGLGSGTYFVRLETAGVQQTQSVTLLK